MPSLPTASHRSNGSKGPFRWGDAVQHGTPPPSPSPTAPSRRRGEMLAATKVVVYLLGNGVLVEDPAAATTGVWAGLLL